MADLAGDTAVDGAHGHYRRRLSSDWEIWGPNGGYIASVALRAAGEHSRFERPVSIVGHFLGVAAFDDVDIEVTTLRASKRVESLRVSMTQGNHPIFEGLVWAAGDVPGLEHETQPVPDVAAPEAVPTVEERLAALGDDEPRPPFRFWENFEYRPLDWVDDWLNRPKLEPRFRAWYRYTPVATYADPWVDACRSLILVDTLIWPAAHRHYPPHPPFVAPSIDLAVTFHRLPTPSDWLLILAEAPIARAGTVHGSGLVWTCDGALAASGTSTLLWRPGVTGG